MSATGPAGVAFLLRLGDSALVLGQRLCAWTGHAPVLEEDLACTNVALDLIGQARMWLAYAGEIEGAGRDADRLAYFRGAHEFRNVLLVERSEVDYAQTIARQFLFDSWHVALLGALSVSADARVAAVAQKAAREAAYHVRRSGDWVVRLGDGTPESHARMQAALEDAWPYTGELFAPDDVDRAMADAKVGCDVAGLREPWRAHVARVVAEATLALPPDGYMHLGGKAGRHTEALSYLLAEMQSVARAVPAERW